MQRKTCKCGGACHGSSIRCAINVHLQSRRAQAIDERREAMQVVRDPVVLALCTFADGSRAALDCDQFCRYGHAVVDVQLVSA
jgi:hypothetical protein